MTPARRPEALSSHGKGVTAWIARDGVVLHWHTPLTPSEALRLAAWLNEAAEWLKENER